MRFASGMWRSFSALIVAYGTSTVFFVNNECERIPWPLEGGVGRCKDSSREDFSREASRNLVQRLRWKFWYGYPFLATRYFIK
jgi:hypothetical protein